MHIQACQFIKYDAYTSIDYIEKVYKTCAVICFDFEDGILDPLKMDRSASIKKEAREIFNYLYTLINKFNKDIKVGVRLNSCKTLEFEKDLIIIRDKTFDTIFAPKIEQPDEMQLISGKLNEFKTVYKNLIPIIESKKVLKI